MARRYATTTSLKGWATEPCEDKLLIGYYEDIKGNVGPSVSWPALFEVGFYDDGLGVLDNYLKYINSVRKRLNVAAIVLKETDVGAYARRHDQSGKAKQRQQWREDYLSLSSKRRKEWQENALAEIAMLPPPHSTFDQYVGTFGRKGEEPEVVRLGPLERDRRANALEASKAVKVVRVAEESAKPAPDPTRLLRQLKLAKPETVAKLIDGLTNSDLCLDLADQIEDRDMRDLLVQRSIDIV